MLKISMLSGPTLLNRPALSMCSEGALEELASRWPNAGQSLASRSPDHPLAKPSAC